MTNEEKILETLEKHGELLEKQSGILEKHGELLEKQSGILEKHGELLAQLQEDMNDMRTTLTKVAVTQENIVLPRLDLLAEGQKTLMETLAPKSRVEALEDDVAFMKTVIKALSQEIEELKKAQ